MLTEANFLVWPLRVFLPLLPVVFWEIGLLKTKDFRYRLVPSALATEDHCLKKKKEACRLNFLLLKANHSELISLRPLSYTKMSLKGTKRSGNTRSNMLAAFVVFVVFFLCVCFKNKNGRD